MKRKIQLKVREMQALGWGNEAQSLQNASYFIDLRTMYQLWKEVYGHQSSSYTPLKSKDGSKILRKPDKIHQRWRIHNSELLNRITTIDESVLRNILQLQIKWTLNEPLSKTKVKKAISQMNNGKPPGIYGIPAEVIIVVEAE